MLEALRAANLDSEQVEYWILHTLRKGVKQSQT